MKVVRLRTNSFVIKPPAGQLRLSSTISEGVGRWRLARVRDEHKAGMRRRRNAAYYARRCRSDQVRFYAVPFLDSDVRTLVADLNTDHRAGRQQISDREWKKLVGRAIAAAARLALKK